MPTIQELRALLKTQSDERPKLEPCAAFPGACIRRITSTERDALEASRTEYRVEFDRRGRPDIKDLKFRSANYRARHVVLFLADATGKRLYGSTDGELAEVGALDHELLDQIFAQGMRFNGLDDGSLELEKKDSPSTPSSTTGTPSPPS